MDFEKDIGLVDTFDVLLNDADGTPLFNSETKERCSITMLGPSSEVVMKRGLKRSQKFLNQLAKSRGKPVPMNAEELEQAALDDLTEFTVSLNHFTYGGRTDKQAIREMYASPELLHIRKQVDEQAGDLENFMRKQPATQLMP